MQKISILLVTLFLFTTALLNGEEATFELSIKVLGAEPSFGQIAISVFSSPENYLKEPIEEAAKPVSEKGDAVFQLDLAEGT